MTKANDLASLLDANGDVVSSALDNVPANPTLTSLGIPNHDDITVDGSGNLDVTGTVVTDGFELNTLAIGGDTFGVVKSANNTAAGFEFLGDSSGTKGARVYYEGNGNLFTIAENTSGTIEPRLVIDDGGNVLVAKTSTGIGTVGHQLQTNGLAQHVADDINPLQLNRKTSDGSIIEMRKDGTIVGRIGAVSGVPYFYGSSGFRLGGSIQPITSTGALSDNTTDIGQSNARFKDLYLSGGVVFGTTAGYVTSKTLRDYEEGIWVPEVRTSGGTVLSAASLSGRYTKIGRLVHVNGDLTNINTTGGTSSHAVRVFDLPFTIDGDLSFGSCISSVVTFQGARTQITARANTSEYIEFFANGSGLGFTPIDVGDLSSGVSDLNFTITYYTNE